MILLSQSAVWSAARRAAQAGGRSIGGPVVPTAPMKVAAIFLALLMAMAPATFGQALPAAEAAPVSTGFALPRTAGTLQYAVTGSGSLTSGYYSNSGTNYTTNLSGDLAYLSGGKAYPFSMVFSGGRGWSGSNQPSYAFWNMAVSQVVSAGRWSFVVSDSVSYLPETASTGLSGVPGVGDLGVDPVQVGDITGQGVLTNYSARVSNTASGSVQRPITGQTSLQGSGTYGISRFVGNSNSTGLDSDEAGGGGSINHRIDARNGIGGNYSYSTSSYGINEPGFTSQTASGQYSHQFTRKLGMSAAAGPQWTSIDTAGSTMAVSLFASLSLGYAGEFTHYSLAFTRSTNSGFGALGGALSDSVTFGAGRTFARVWGCALTAAYTQTGNLPSAAMTSLSFHTTVLGAQVSRGVARSLSAYASYTLENQSNQDAAAAVDLFSGLSQVVGFGLTYSPASLRLGRQ